MKIGIVIGNLFPGTISENMVGLTPDLRMFWMSPIGSFDKRIDIPADVVEFPPTELAAGMDTLVYFLALELGRIGSAADNYVEIHYREDESPTVVGIVMAMICRYGFRSVFMIPRQNIPGQSDQKLEVSEAMKRHIR